jgi:RNA polymerase sigma-70 factor (ECF subfamily)
MEKDDRHWDEVVRAVLAGDRERFREIVLQFQDELRFIVAFHIRSDADRVDEVVHCAFIRAFRSLPQFQTGRPLAVWLRVIAKREALDEVRRMCRSARQAAERVQAELMKAREDQEAVPEILSHLSHCIERLRDTSKDLVRMRYFEKKGFDEIARILDRTPGALRVAMLQVRRSLRLCMDRFQS